ncbi:hypothetical protein B0T26DRAFT_800831 [Lasiosphaeria miniovina]|uniref:tRNA synthetases class I catalytic domain-containing protein n=1 Tax=Lasiosphaeria miniovina TaxID=1954250 RepID=A0AA40E1Y1_9PEZI|nr:uncharacterized protein B0T26DRAFT_800831 [Lasiosphaeria miniovina]KAK0721972.1 hypothetical protein B0T26DRAFT_800831 [Lasiosphaeria miniovina]
MSPGLAWGRRGIAFPINQAILARFLGFPRTGAHRPDWGQSGFSMPLTGRKGPLSASLEYMHLTVYEFIRVVLLANSQLKTLIYSTFDDFSWAVELSLLYQNRHGSPPQARPDAQLPRLKIYNSLTKSKDDFVPVDPTGTVVTWYACGPTVYEDAHLGHAKNYVSTDVIRRIMRDYFGFCVSPETTATTTTHELTIGDQQFLSSLEKAKADVHTALCDSFNTSAVMRILSDLVTESNSAEALSDQTVILLTWWITRIVTIFGLDPEGDLSNVDRIGWSSLDIPALAKPYIHPASQLRDKVRTLACSGSVDHTAIARLADGITIAASALVVESSAPYDQMLQQFRTNVKPSRPSNRQQKSIYLEDREEPQPALVRPLDKLIIEARTERESTGTAKTKATLEQKAKDAKREKELHECAKRHPILDAAGNVVSKNRRKKLVKEWEKKKEMHEEWLAKQQAA